MNIYLVVEGNVGEKQVYAHWVPLVNPSISVVSNIDDVSKNNLFIIGGGGYPNYFDVIKDGALDVNSLDKFDRLVVAIDSEQMSHKEKRIEVEDYMNYLGLNINYKIIVQHFCLETWALGNIVIVSRRPRDSRLAKYKRFFDVLTRDPELLPDWPDENMNRSQVAECYLRRLLNDKYRNLTYSKRDPSALLNDSYYQRVKSRHDNTGHISSFKDFIQAFI